MRERRSDLGNQEFLFNCFVLIPILLRHALFQALFLDDSELWAGRARDRTRGGREVLAGRRRAVLRAGVTYGTFAETELGLFPAREQVKEDFAAMAAVGINTVRTYTVPGSESSILPRRGLKVLTGVWWDDPRYLDSVARGSWKKLAVEARAAVKEAVESYAAHPAVLGFVLGNEIPGPVVRWHGRRVEDLLRSLFETGKDAAPEALFSYANYSTTQYLDTSCFDFDCFDVFLEEESAYQRYLAQLQVAAGDRPLILTELGLDSGGAEDRQADTLDWQMRGAMELGLTVTCVFSWPGIEGSHA